MRKCDHCDGLFNEMFVHRLNAKDLCKDCLFKEASRIRGGYIETVAVPKGDLKFMTSFRCEHDLRGSPKCNLKEAEDRGGCCNACWAAWWAKERLVRDPLTGEVIPKEPK